MEKLAHHELHLLLRYIKKGDFEPYVMDIIWHTIAVSFADHPSILIDTIDKSHSRHIGSPYVKYLRNRLVEYLDHYE
jgi:hypothetical protein